jgi:hypothetical protein
MYQGLINYVEITFAAEKKMDSPQSLPDRQVNGANTSVIFPQKPFKPCSFISETLLSLMLYSGPATIPLMLYGKILKKKLLVQPLIFQ